MARNHRRNKGKERVSMKPGWIGGGVPLCDVSDTALSNRRLLELYKFYVLETPFESISNMAISLNKRGWKKNVWTDKQTDLRKKLLDDLGFLTNASLFICTAVDETKELFKAAKMSKDFKRDCKEERIAIYHSESAQFMSILRHVRNSLAHGRFAAKKRDGEVWLFFEDGKKDKFHFAVRSRMVLKYSTLEKWMQIIRKEEQK